jgi:hypothetical protein
VPTAMQKLAGAQDTADSSEFGTELVGVLMATAVSDAPASLAVRMDRVVEAANPERRILRNLLRHLIDMAKCARLASRTTFMDILLACIVE